MFNSINYLFLCQIHNSPQKGYSSAVTLQKKIFLLFDLFEYDYRTSLIKDTKGEIVFQMDNVEVPKQWSQIATDILAQKYFRKAGIPQPDGSTGRETSVKQVAHRMAHCWRVWGERNNYFATEKMLKYFMMSWCIVF